TCISPLSLHDALPISHLSSGRGRRRCHAVSTAAVGDFRELVGPARYLAAARARTAARVDQRGAAGVPEQTRHAGPRWSTRAAVRSEEHTSELQSLAYL